MTNYLSDKMNEKELNAKIDIIIDEMKELEKNSQSLTNGERYAAINIIEKQVNPLRSDLKVLEQELRKEKDLNSQLYIDYERILNTVSELRDLKSDINRKIQTDNEHLRIQMNQEIVNLFKTELTPIHNDIKQLNCNMQDLTISTQQQFNELDRKILMNEEERKTQEAQRFSKLTQIFTGAVGIIAALSAIALYFEPPIHGLLHAFGL